MKTYTNFDFDLKFSDGFYFAQHEAGQLQFLETDLNESQIIEKLDETKTEDSTVFYSLVLEFNITRKSVGFFEGHDIVRLLKCKNNKFTLIWDANR